MTALMLAAPVSLASVPVIEVMQPERQPIAFGAILADCPWRYSVWRRDTGKGRTADLHYQTMQLADIMALPVARLAARDCVLFLWATMPMLPEALAVMEAWGFSFKTVAFSWMKTNRRSGTLFTGLGYWTRSNAELCLLGLRGKPKRKARDVKQAILAPLREHSRKPDEVRERIERLVDGPYIELFARQRRAGWYTWGNAVECSPYASALIGTGQRLLPMPSER